MSALVTDLVRQVADSPFNDRLTRSIDTIVVLLVLVLLVEYELVQQTKRAKEWKRSTKTWVFLVPLAFAVLLVFAQRVTNSR